MESSINSININNSNKRKIKTWEKQKKAVFWFFIFLSFILAFIYDPPKDLDRFENYSIGRSLTGMSFQDIVLYYFNNGFDFIFYIGLGAFSKSLSGLQLFMGIITALYYYALFKPFIKIPGSLTLNKFLLFVGLLCLPSVLYVVNLSRTVFAIVFFTFGVACWLKKKYIAHLVLFVVTFFTHAGTIIFIALFYIGVLLYFLLKNKPYLTSFLCIILPPTFFVLFRILFMDALQNAFLIDLFFDTKYDQYFNATGKATLDISIGALLSIYCEIFLSYVLVNLDRQVSLNKIVFLVFTTITASVLTVNQNLLNRFILVLPVFYSYYLFELINNNKVSGRRYGIRQGWLILSTAICLVVFALNIYLERKSFLPFLFG